MKFPRTPHLPGSKGTSDDLHMNYHYNGMVIATEKMDGSNIMMNREHFITRKGASSRYSLGEWASPMYQVFNNIGYKIPKNIWIAGEFLHWRKTINYNQLDSSYMMFGAIKNNKVLSWEDTKNLSQDLGIPLVKELSSIDTFDKVLLQAHKNWDTEKEGFVIRPIDSFQLPQYSTMVAKWVRSDFTPTETNNGINTYNKNWLDKAL